jgi:hypothetical protein
MANRTKLLVHFRRLSSVLDHAIRSGPDGTLEGKFEVEHPTFVHYACAFYLIGCLAYLESEDGAYSWDSSSSNGADFDVFVSAFPPSPKPSFRSMGVTKAAMRTLADIRNAVIHHGGDLARLKRAKNADVLAEVKAANIPGVMLSGAVVTLEAPFLEFVRKAALAVRNYHGEC